MSHYIPFDIQEIIIKSLPVKSLIQFRPVSKQWKFFIDSSDFINDYHVRHTGPHHLIISKEKPILLNPRILRSSCGLLLGSCLDYRNKERGVLWNPLIRKSVAIEVPSVLRFFYSTIVVKTVVGFGVCRCTNDPKIVKITSELGISDRLWELEAFTLSSGTWKRLPFTRNLDESIYWLAFDGRTNNAIFEWYDLIMSIDMTSEEFTQENMHHSLFSTKLPLIKQSLATQAGEEVDLFISKVRKHLAEHYSNVDAAQIYHLWIKDNSLPKSFLERFDIGKPHVCIKKVYGERNYGECVSRDGSRDHFKQDALFIYKPHSHDINSIRIFGKRYSFFASRELDQLLLLDH